MIKKKFMTTLIMLMLLATITSGCAVVGTAITAGISYAIYQATKK